ncbi:hypothetical protein BDQ94DRAFT_132096 [Aspergillus welwitschiae]|uniref:Uncharacterized protein n=1 Tax=Aspergillus welwitschiae TaxID=1341132 RepID=A0A3F3QJV6_9EURO|nr:hypothetical protein BDQ94DRAFT_132096 [Aspergillus welwitschiae]RDH38966.1 hypothetical protein BDQ94DRAFT_132096 [Aspergillus welwitschiae]
MTCSQFQAFALASPLCIYILYCRYLTTCAGAVSLLNSDNTSKKNQSINQSINK